MRKKVTLISLHHYNSKRKVDFHYIADNFVSRGWTVNFITAPLSPFSKIIGDHRWQYTNICQINRPIPVGDSIIQYTYAPWYSPLSKTGHFIIDHISPLFLWIYGRKIPENLKKMIQDSDLFIMESNAAILLFDHFKRICPNSKFVYRADDALETLHVHDKVLSYEKEISSRFDLITVPSYDLFSRFTGDNVLLQHHGIEKKLFNDQRPKPESYNSFTKNLFFIGVAHLDIEFIRIAALLFPDYGFHIIGPLNVPDIAPNVIRYGEMPHIKTIPYLQHADVGLHILRTSVGLQTYTDSMKVIQYTWCRLPIIAPSGIPSERKHFIHYEYDDSESIRNAINSAVCFDRNLIDRSNIYDWSEFVQKILDEV